MVNILVGTDYSENSNRALNAAVDLAEKLDANLTILNTIQYVPGIIFAAAEKNLPENYFVDMKKTSEQAMAEVVKKIKSAKPKVKVTSIVKIGSPINEIISMSENFNFVIIGRSGENSSPEAFMGTTGQRIANMAKCPIIIIP